MNDNTLEDILRHTQNSGYAAAAHLPEGKNADAVLIEAKQQLTQMVKEIIGSSPSHYDDECSPDNGCFCMAGQEIAVKEEQKQRARKYGLEIEQYE